MKRLLMGASFLALSLLGRAQDREFKPFKVDVSLGYAIPQGSGAKGGVLFSVEPKYGITDDISLGLRIEGAVVARSITLSYQGESETAGGGDLKASSSYALTGDYYFSKKTFRPFVGAGLGLFSITGASIKEGGAEFAMDNSTKFGGLIRAGFELSHFRMGLEYNLVGKSKISDSGAEVSSKNGYLGIKVGVVFGGGRTK